MSNVSIQRCNPADIAACFEIISTAFKHDAPFIDINFPRHDTPAGRAQATERLLKWLQSDENSFFLKATQTHREDAGREDIAGFAIWTHMTTPPPADLSSLEDMELVWPDSDDREFASRLWRKYVGPRSNVLRSAGEKRGALGRSFSGSDVSSRTISHQGLVLELLAVHPGFQRSGVGTKLVKWGTLLADEKGIEVMSAGRSCA